MTTNTMNFPNVLYRGFTEINHANDFIDGRFRLGLLDSYQNIENAARADPSEGDGHYVSSDGISEYFKSGNPTYLLCCSDGNVELAFLRQKMGPFIVRINQPEQLTSLINDFLKKKGINAFKGVQGAPVQYNKGQIVHEELDPEKKQLLSIIQKPSGFADEHEYRLYAMTNIEGARDQLEQFLSVDLEQKLPFVELLPCEE